jgi:hypothetical protein
MLCYHIGQWLNLRLHINKYNALDKRQARVIPNVLPTLIVISKISMGGKGEGRGGEGRAEALLAERGASVSGKTFAAIGAVLGRKCLFGDIVSGECLSER